VGTAIPRGYFLPELGPSLADGFFLLVFYPVLSSTSAYRA